jgi:cytochrome c biogenesis protein
MTVSHKQGSNPQGLGLVFSAIASFFTSVRTTIGLLFLLASASVLGTVIPQDLSPDQLQQTASSLSYRLMVILDLHTVYRSWWFILLLTLLALNLLGCLIKRLPAIPAEWRHDYRKNSFSFTVTDPRPVPDLQAVLSGRMSALLRVSPRQVNTESGQALAWIRDRMQLLGFPLMHAAIIFILLGGLIGLFYGVKGHVLIKEGDSARRFSVTPSGETRILPFAVFVDAFTLTRYPTGEPKEFRSDIRLLADDKEVYKGAILVNHPVTYQGISLYQADYRVSGIRGVTLMVTDKDGKESELVVKPYERTPVPGTAYGLRLLVVDPGTTKLGPGAEMSLESDSGEDRTIRLFKNDQEPTYLGDTKLRFDNYLPLYATGLQIGYDPGTALVWTGCLSLILGFLLTLFTNHRSVLMEFRTEGKTTTVRVSGRSKRLRKEFREQVERTTRESLGAADEQ